MSDGIFTSKDRALRAIGRTVVNFQRLERNLKFMARFGPIAGTLSKVQRDIDNRVDKAASFTLGQAIHAWLGAFDNNTLQTHPINDLFEPTIRVTFSLGIDAETHRGHADALGALLEIRNNLVHGRFAQFDWGSQEACEALVEELNGVNEVIAPQIDFLAAINKAMQSIQPEDVEIQKSPTPG